MMAARVAKKAKYKFRWKPGARFSVRVEGVLEELERIKERDGDLKPQAVVDSARSPESPLHKLFDQDDSTAANSWRVHQARQIINDVEYEIVQGPGKPLTYMPYYVSVVSEAGRGYLPTPEVMSQEELREQAISDALNVLMGWQKRHASFVEFQPIFDAIDRVRAKLEAS